MLANKAAIRLDESISPGDQSEIDNGDESSVKDFNQMVHYEICTIWAQSFIVQRQRNVLTAASRCDQEQCSADEKQEGGEQWGTRSHSKVQKLPCETTMVYKL